MVAIVSCIKSQEMWKSINGTGLHEFLLPSVSRFLTDEERRNYRIEVLLAFDKDDAFWENPENRLQIIKTNHDIPVSFISVVNNRTHHIPFNEACRSAYEYGADYIVRVNDDSEFVSQGWITKAINTLAAYNPPNVGVVGPTCHQGNTKILTHDMVHRTHLEIFDDYYPDELDNWWIDDWITNVYGKSRTTKIASWLVVHHEFHHGTRYRVDDSQHLHLKRLVDRGKDRIQEYLDSGETADVSAALGTPRIAFMEGPIAVTTPPALSSNETYPNKYIRRLLNAARRARKRNPYGSYVVIQLLDKGFITMTKHWICNVRRFGMILSAVAFIATDMDAYELLREFDRNLNVVYVPYERPTDQQELSYGQVAYFELMSFRTMLMHNLLENNISFMIVESDSVWNRNALEEISKLDWDFDVLSASDSGTMELVQGGFQLNQATENSKIMWSKLYKETIVVIRNLRANFGRDSTKYVEDAGSEQLMMQSLANTLRQEIGYKLRFMPTTICASGQWYTDPEIRKQYPNPSVILNNWIIGNSNKFSRAKANKHWFLDEGTSKCLDPDPIRQNMFRATIVILTMDRVESLNRLLTSLVVANYSTPNTDSINDIRLVIRIDRPTIETNDFHRIVELASNFTHPSFSNVSVEIQGVNKGLRSQWLTSFQDPRGWDEIGLILEDDLQVSPHFFRYLRLQWLFHWNNPLVGSISLQRQTLRASLPYNNDATIVNKHRPFLYRLIGSWGMSVKASTWIDFTSTYSAKTAVGIEGLLTTEWYDKIGSTMWEQHFIHYLWKHNQFTQYITLPNDRTMCGNWREPGVHFSGAPKIDFPLAENWVESSMGALDSTLPTYDFDTKPVVVHQKAALSAIP